MSNHHSLFNNYVGNVGWGVLGAFGNNEKDERAQVMRRDDSQKMVKNEKGE